MARGGLIAAVLAVVGCVLAGAARPGAESSREADAARRAERRHQQCQPTHWRSLLLQPR
jgi:hypothetical protein